LIEVYSSLDEDRGGPDRDAGVKWAEENGGEDEIRWADGEDGGGEIIVNDGRCKVG